MSEFSPQTLKDMLDLFDTWTSTLMVAHGAALLALFTAFVKDGEQVHRVARIGMIFLGLGFGLALIAQLAVAEERVGLILRGSAFVSSKRDQVLLLGGTALSLLILFLLLMALVFWLTHRAAKRAE